MIAFLKRYYALSLVVLIMVVGGGLLLSGFGDIGRWVLIGGSILVTVRLAVEMILTLRSGRVGIDILAIAAIVSTLVVGEYWASIVIVLMLTGGEALETFAGHRARRELTALLERAPQTAHILNEDGSSRTVAINAIRKDDLLVIRPGEVVPVDSILKSDAAELDESSLTGESFPVSMKGGDELLSGSVNTSETITVIALRAAKDSQYQKIVDLVAAAADSQAPFVRLADRFAIPFTIVSFIIAGSAWALSGDPVRFAEVLVLATPCPLLLATPIALISGMSRAAKNGIIVKSGGVLETLARVKEVAFDKTGTLTKGEPEVSAIVPAASFTANELLALAASAEQESLHTLGRAIVAAAKSKKLTLQKVSRLKESVASGIEATVGSHRVLVGKASFLESKDVTLPTSRPTKGSTVVSVAVDGAFAGTISFEDQVRSESRRTIARLKRLGVKAVMMLTGDGEVTARRIGHLLGITDIRADLLPEQKVAAVRAIRRRPVMMVGDGVNDAPVLAAADVGVALGARGSTAATETADVVILVDNLAKTWQAVLISKKTIAIAVQGILIGIGLSLALMLIATTGVIPAIIGATLQEVVDVIVILNALRVHTVKV